MEKIYWVIFCISCLSTIVHCSLYFIQCSLKLLKAKENFSASFGSICHRLEISLSRDVSRHLTSTMLIFQPLLLKFPLWCLPLSEGPYHHSPFDIICSLYKQEANPWESVENDRAGWCCYIRAARIATCPYLHLNLSLSHGQQSPFPAGWMSWGAACDRTASRPDT